MDLAKTSNVDRHSGAGEIRSSRVPDDEHPDSLRMAWHQAADYSGSTSATLSHGSARLGSSSLRFVVVGGGMQAMRARVYRGRARQPRPASAELARATRFLARLEGGRLIGAWAVLVGVLAMALGDALGLPPFPSFIVGVLLGFSGLYATAHRAAAKLSRGSQRPEALHRR